MFEICQEGKKAARSENLDKRHNLLDRVSVIHKFNPYDQARTPQSMKWRCSNDCLKHTNKGSHEGNGGRVAYVFCGKRMIMCRGSVLGTFVVRYLHTSSGKILRIHFERAAIQKLNIFYKMVICLKMVKKSKTAVDEVGARQFQYQPAVQI